MQIKKNVLDKYLSVKYSQANKVGVCVSITVCIILIALINLLTIQGIRQNVITVTSKESPMEHETYEFPEPLENEQECYQQYFKPQYDYVQNLQVRLALNDANLLETYDWKIQLSLLDENDALICSTTVEDSEITNWKYYRWNIEQNLDMDKMYKLELRQIEGQKEDGKYVQSFVPFYSQVHIDENIQFMHNDKKIDNEIEIIYTYQYENIAHYIGLFVVDIVLVLIMVLSYQYFKKNEILKAMLLLTPVVVMIVSELIAGNFFTIKIRYWIIGLILNYFIYCLFVLFSKRIKWAAIFYCVIYVVIALVIYYVEKLGGRPFLLQNIIATKTATNVMARYSYELDLVVGCSVLFILTWALVMLMQKNLYLEGIIIKRKLIVIVLCVVITFALSNGVLTNISGMSFDMWVISSNYTTKGNTITLLSQVEYLFAKQPEGYSVKAVEDNVEAYAKEEVANSENTIEATNIILIMNESWGDFNYIAPLETNKEITPFMDSLSENVERGYLHMSVFGGDTANSEYEVLTGNTVQFLPKGSYPYQLYASSTQWGLASSLKQQGYGAIALHPHERMNWNRNNVYEKMLFDKFFSWENWCNENPDIIRWYVSDKDTYKALIDLYNEKEDKEKLFSFLVTMQNHGAYDVEGYESTIKLKCNGTYPETEQYLTLINESDAAFETLVEHFSTVTEPTMIVMFGDHLPRVEDEFYEELFGKELEDLSLEEEQKRYVTPYIIWTNYDCDMEQNVEMSANYFGSYVLEKAGVSLTDYQKCNIEFRKEIPIIGVGGVYDANGNWYEMNSLPETLESTLNKYKILQYNYVFGGKNRKDEIFTLE